MLSTISVSPAITAEATNKWKFPFFKKSLFLGTSILACTLLPYKLYSENLSTDELQSKPLVTLSYVNSRLEGYTPEEHSLIRRDLAIIRDLCFFDAKPVTGEKSPVYYGSAGAPGSCKTTILETFLQDKENFVYADPDQRALRYMVFTYLLGLNNYNYSLASSSSVLRIEQYAKWRGASNYICSVILNEAFKGRHNIAHGTTATSPQVEGFYQRLKEAGYEIVLNVCLATDNTRAGAIKHRDEIQAFYQSTSEDALKKGYMFFDRMPVYFKYANELYFYWSDEGQFSNPDGKPKKSTVFAKFTKKDGLVVSNESLMAKFKDQYNQRRKAETSLPAFEKLFEAEG